MVGLRFKRQLGGIFLARGLVVSGGSVSRPEQKAARYLSLKGPCAQTVYTLAFGLKVVSIKVL